MRRQSAGWRGPRFVGPGFIRDFLRENEECAEQLVRYGVARMRAEGCSDDEIRDHLLHIQEQGFGDDLDVDELLS